MIRGWPAYAKATVGRLGWEKISNEGDTGGENELLQQEQTLEKLEKETGKHWYESEFSSYTVEDVQIHW